MPATLGDRAVRLMPYALLGVATAWAAMRAAVPLHDPDSWWHLRLGEFFLDERSLAPPAHWSTFATMDWVPTQPLPEVATTLVMRWLGLPGVVWVFAASVVVVIVAVFLGCRTDASPLAASVATLSFIAAGQNAFTPRPQMVSYLLLVVVVVAWLRTEQDLKPRWWLVPLSLVWSLCHGFWFIGVGYGLLFVLALAVSRRVRPVELGKFAALSLASGLVVLLNPLGPQVFAGPFLVNGLGRFITEWQRASLLAGPGLIVLLMVVVTAAVWLRKPATASTFKVLMLLSALFWAWYSIRTVTLGGVVAAPLLAGALQSLIPVAEVPATSRIRHERLGTAVAVIALLAVVGVAVPHTAPGPGGVPLALDPMLDQVPAGATIFNEYELGGWLAWRHPAINRYIDGLAVPYSVDHFQDYVDIVTLRPDWQGAFAHADASVALIAEESALADVLVADGWTVEGVDGGYVLLEHPGSAR